MIATSSGWLVPVYCAVAAPEAKTASPAKPKVKSRFVIVDLRAPRLFACGHACFKR
jgi:hypothetical protein